ncbi:DUF7694 domain-containing protein [Ktedonobacter racemifer]|uniref:DUF7694 domain-containing protein n=1 Tax=Ktedonobacter racemifer TaxID=363277 RepID=UPI003B75BB2A
MHICRSNIDREQWSKSIHQNVALAAFDLFVRIKDELVGPECEGVELFPARSREVDTANHYHLWTIDDPAFRFPFGFTRRLVTEVTIGDARQEPWPANERPADCLSEEEMRALLQKEQRRRS